MREFMSMLLICSATMSVFGLVYMALAPLLTKRYSAGSRYYAWLIIVFGLMIPFRPRLGNAFVAYQLPAQTILPVAAQSNVYTMITPSVIPDLPSATPSFSLWEVATAVWFVGMISFIIYHAIKHFRFAKMTMRWSENVTLEQTLSILNRAKAEIGITREIGLHHCPSIGSPTLVGWMNPRILLPQAAFSEDELAFILRHELIHFKRGDLWYKCAVLLAAAIHWFNPIIYLLVKAIDSACELSCDAETVRYADVDARQRYSETIIGVVRHQSKLKTALSTNFYGGKRGMKKRIDSIMDAQRKKTGIILLCGMLLLTLATGIAFAGSTAESKAPSWDRYDPIPDIQAVSETDQAMMTRFDPETGKTFYSWDLGKTWTHMTNEEYDRMFSQPAAQWWTYDEYKAWMEEQVKGLQALVDDGATGYYDEDGVLHNFVQADVDEMTTLYQATLENIKNGFRVSKPVSGSALSQDVLPVAAEIYAVASDYGNVETVHDYSEYSQYGLTLDQKTDQLCYHGELVRRFYDERTSSVVTRTFNPNGVVDITAKRNSDNELIGLYKHSQQEFDERTKAMGAATSFSVAEQHAVTVAQTDASPAYDYSQYAPYGLSYDQATRKLYYKGELVRYFEDSYPLGEDMAAYWDHFDQDGTIDVHAIRDLSKIVYNSDGSYDPSGILIGVEPYSQAEFNARDITQYVYDNRITQIAIGKSIEEDLRPYQNFGVSYDSKASMIMHNGVPVREIYDPHLGKLITLSGGVGFPNGAIPEGAIDLTARYENGILTGFRKSTDEEFNMRTQNRSMTANATTVSQNAAESYQNPIASESSASASADVSAASWSSTPYSASATAVYENTAGIPEREGDTFGQIFERYKEYGITFDPNSAVGGLGNIYHHGKLVKTFVDIKPDGGVISFSSSDGGEIIIRTVYNQDGQCTGLEVSEE